MDVDLKQRIEGQTLRSVRDLLRRNQIVSASDAAAFLRISEAQAEDFLDALLRAGYLELDEGSTKHWGYRCYEASDLGVRLRAASALARISRAKADQIVAQVVSTIGDISADEDLIFSVKEARVFGSYLSSSPTLGDVDLLVRLEPRSQYADCFVERSIERARAQGKSHLAYILQASYGRIEVKRLIKRVSRYVSVHEAGDLRHLKLRSRRLLA